MVLGRSFLRRRKKYNKNPALINSIFFSFIYIAWKTPEAKKPMNRISINFWH